jgi:UDP-glucose 4-epimerase
LAQEEDALVSAMRGVDVVVHLAAPNEIVCNRDPVEALLSGGIGCLKLLRAARKVECRRFIFLSTIHVYGSPLIGRIVETNLPNPLHPYAIVHRTAEDFVLAAHAKGEMEGVVLRLSNGIGAPAWATVDRWTLIGNDLCQQAISNNCVVLKSSGLQWRDFIMLRDFVQALNLMIEVPPKALNDGLFNLGGRLPLRMIDIAELVAQRASAMLDRQIDVRRETAPPNENWSSVDYAIDRIAIAGFAPSPQAQLANEIDETLALCRDSLG